VKLVDYNVNNVNPDLRMKKECQIYRIKLYMNNDTSITIQFNLSEFTDKTQFKISSPFTIQSTKYLILKSMYMADMITDEELVILNKES